MEQEVVPSELPVFVAVPWRSYVDAHHPRLALHSILDVAEMGVRLCTALVMGEVRHLEGGALPPELLRTVKRLVQRPTLGMWVRLGIVLSKRLPPDSTWARVMTDVVAPAFRESDGIDTSLLSLRNHAVHCGGMTTQSAAALVDAHRVRIIHFARALREAFSESQLVAVQQGRAWSLMGPEPRPCPGPIEDDVYVLGPKVLSLFPLVRSVASEADSAPQPLIYHRADARGLSHTPILGDEVEVVLPREPAVLRALGLDQVADGFRWDDFLEEARTSSASFVGRGPEIRRVLRWVEEAGSGSIGWIDGQPGIGKSALLSRVAGGASVHRPVFLHAFRTGDGRNDRRTFLDLMRWALWSWQATDAEVVEPRGDLDQRGLARDVKRRLRELHDGSRALFVIDGLDEILRNDPDFADLVAQLARSGGVWLVAGRGSRVPRTFEPLFETGLPAMSAADVWAMLLDGLSSKRRLLVARDFEEDDEVSNDFVQAVVERAAGLPIYVRLVVDDLARGRLSPDEADRLPDSLEDYYAALLSAYDVEGSSGDLALLLALLVVAREPLDDSGLALLMGGRRRHRMVLPRVRAAIDAARPLLRKATTASGHVGLTVYHDRFREYVLQASLLHDAVEEARDRLAEAAVWCDDAGEDPLRHHLFLHGVDYCLDISDVEEAVRLLVDFERLHRRCAVIGRRSEDLARIGRRLAAHRTDGDLDAWTQFFDAKSHLLAASEPDWPSERILVQLAAEEPEHSPVRRSVDAWLSAADHGFIWMRRVSPDPTPPGIVRTLFVGDTAEELLVNRAFTRALLLTGHYSIEWYPDAYAIVEIDLERFEILSRTELDEQRPSTKELEAIFGEPTVDRTPSPSIDILSIASGGREIDARHLPLCIAFPDERRVLSGGADGVLRVWDLAQLGTTPVDEEAKAALERAREGYSILGGLEALLDERRDARPARASARFWTPPSVRINEDLKHVTVSHHDATTLRVWRRYGDLIAAWYSSWPILAASFDNFLPVPSTDVRVAALGDQIVVDTWRGPVRLALWRGNRRIPLDADHPPVDS